MFNSAPQHPTDLDEWEKKNASYHTSINKGKQFKLARPT